MKAVDQTRFAINSKTEAPGNCWAACIASVLEIPLTDVPDEADFWKSGMTPQESWDPYSTAVHEWLVRFGYALIEVRTPSVYYSGPEHLFAMHCILSGPSPRNEKASHAVVARGRDIVHDPHPSRAGLTGDPKYWYYEFFVRI